MNLLTILTVTAFAITPIAAQTDRLLRRALLQCVQRGTYERYQIDRFCPEVLGKLEVYLDGGVRSGTDVIKALCLGATRVGLGRPFLYELSGYGTDGMIEALELMSDEVETALFLLDVVNLYELNPTF
ncbi:FMN-dependent dehydrogenase-domain-containing protein [Aspergillus aurantiobrunneus]